MMKKFALITQCIIISLTLNTFAQNSNFKGFTKVNITTDSGIMTFILYDETKLHKENFLKLVNEQFYNDLLFHRLINNFMIQGGDPDSKNSGKGVLLGQGGPGYTIPAEIYPKYFHKKGALAAARKGDKVNPTKASSGSQFYIIQGRPFTKSELDVMVQTKIHAPFTNAETIAYTKDGGSPHLDGQYTVFGELINGFDVLDKLMKVPVDINNRPTNDIKFRIKIIE